MKLSQLFCLNLFRAGECGAHAFLQFSLFFLSPGPSGFCPPFPKFFHRFYTPIHTHYRYTKILALPGLGRRSLEFLPHNRSRRGELFTSASKVRLSAKRILSHPLTSRCTNRYHSERACEIFLRSYPIFENNSGSSHIPIPNPMAQYATLSFRLSGAKDKTHISDNLFRVTQTQSDILGCCSGNKGDNNTYDSYNNKFEFVLPSRTDFVVRNQGGVSGAGEAGIIRIPERYSAKS